MEGKARAARQAAEKMCLAYDLYIETLCWERDRILKLAEKLAAEQCEEKADQMCDAQAEYIRKQVFR